MRQDLFVIEARKPDGTLDLSGLQPETVFGMAAITGISEDGMARVIFRRLPEACLQGDRISSWPSMIDPRFKARRKTW